MTNQINMFEQINEGICINKPIRLIELFAGIGSQAKALKNIGADFEHYRVCEFDKYAIASYNAIHGTDFPVSDITKWHAADLGIEQKDRYEYIMTYSFPCFVGDSFVLTDKGYKRIDETKVGDMVLSHDNQYHKVLNIFNNGEKEVFEIKGMSMDSITATKNHKFYIRERYRKGYLGIRTFREPIWKELKNLTKNDYLGMAINQNSIIPKWNGIDFEWSDGRKIRHKNELSALMDNGDFWWIIGRYVADGWHRKQGGIVISSGYAKTEEIESRLSRVFKYSKAEEITAAKYHIPLKELQKFTNEFGVGAYNKKVAGFVFDLPIPLLKSFLDGYMAGDGCFTQNRYKATTISRELALGIGQCVAKVYKRPFSICKVNRGKTCVIEGRIVNQHDTYDVIWKESTDKQDKAFYEDGYIWFPINSIKFRGVENVYDIEVEDSHSFTVQNTIVHNCTDLSIAGKQEGMAKGSGTRSGLLWEVERLLEECQELPQILLMENVPAVIQKKNIKDFRLWINYLENKGYSNHYELLNAKKFGVPQNRERCFMVSVLGDYHYKMPEGFPLSIRVKDVMESYVDEKYYISKKRVKELLEMAEAKKEIKVNGVACAMWSREYTGFKDICPTLCARDYKDPKQFSELQTTEKTVCEERVDEGLRFFKDDCIGAIRTIDGGGDKRVLEPQLKQVAQMYSQEKNEQAGRVYNKDGISPALDTCKGGNRMPKFVEDAEIKVMGNYMKSGHNASRIIDPEGIAPTVKENHGTVTAVCEMNPKEDNGFFQQAIKTFKENNCKEGDTINAFNNTVDSSGISPTITTRPEGKKTAILCVVKEDTIIGSTQKNASLKNDGICPTLTEAMGMGGGQIPMIVNKTDEVNQEDKPKLVGGIGEKNFGKQYRQGNRVYDSDAIEMSLMAEPVGNKGGYSYLYKVDDKIDDKVKIRQATKKGYIECEVGGVADFSYPKSELRRGRVQEGGNVSPAITASGTEIMKIENSEVYYRIRKLTPRECFRLMGFKDIDFTKAKYKFDKESDLIYEIMNEDILESDKVKKIEDMGIKVTERTSNSQLYCQAGNSIVVDVLEAIFRNMNIKGVDDWETYKKGVL